MESDKVKIALYSLLQLLSMGLYVGLTAFNIGYAADNAVLDNNASLLPAYYAEHLLSTVSPLGPDHNKAAFVSKRLPIQARWNIKQLWRLRLHRSQPIDRASTLGHNPLLYQAWSNTLVVNSSIVIYCQLIFYGVEII